MRIHEALLLALAGCPGDDPPGSPPVLDPEPPGAPTEVVGAGGEIEIACLGRNEPDRPDGDSLTLPGWIRDLRDPTNAAGEQPAARTEAFDEQGVSLGAAFSDTGDGRVAITVPVRSTGFAGWVDITAEGFLPQRFRSSRPVTSTAGAGWTWLVRQEDVDDLAADAGVLPGPDEGLVVGAVHDCVGFGYSNAIVRWGERTDGVVYFEDFSPAPDLTYSAESGRFAIAGVEPGELTVEAYGRLEPGGALVLLSRADLDVEAGVVTAVALEPRMGLER